MGRRGRRLRMTRRGRIVVVGLLASLVASGLFTFAAAATDAAAPPPRGVAAVVRENDTLWRIAARELPELDPYEAVDAIRRLNGLADYTVHPGQRLLLPARR